jgi:aspartate aminotransferase
MKAAGRDVINLGSGEPDFDTPQHIKDAAIAAMQAGATKYTAVGGISELKSVVSEKFRRENTLDYAPSQIIVSTGAKQSIYNLMMAVLNTGDEAVFFAPYWVSYPDMALLADATPVAISSDSPHTKITPQQLASVLNNKTKMLLLNSPSNPSGVLYDKVELAALGAVLRDFPDVVIASDDIYEHIRYEGRPFHNILNACPDLAGRTVIINGVSKAYAMTGWRIGYAAGPEYLIKAMTKIQSQGTSNPCSIAQAAAQAAIEAGTDCVEPMLEAFARRRSMVSEKLNAIDCVDFPPIEGAFYAFASAEAAITKLYEAGRISAQTDLAFCDYLLENAGVAMVPGSAFGCENCFRLSFATADNLLEQAVERIGNALA